MPDHDQKLVILYVEDDREIMEQYAEFIRSVWSPQSRGVRSREAVRKLLESGFKPDVVIHDCQVLASEADVTATENAGDQLYALYDRQNLNDRVVIMSGSGECLTREPYLSRPPLGLVDKPVSQDKIRQAVDIWSRKHNGSSQT
jgi:DNA-binding NtrC family response regulator